jgi:hypothetical protein
MPTQPSINLSRDEIIKIQNFLKITADGHFGPITAAAVKNYQTKFGLSPTGIVDSTTYQYMFPILSNTILPTSDLSELFDVNHIRKYNLPKGEYYSENTPKTSIFIHHTAGWNNPFNVIDSWSRDNRGRIGTHYVIGGINPVTGDDSFDGIICQACEDEDWLHHLGVKNSQIDKYSIGIELCNFGYLTKKNNSYLTYTNTAILSKFVCNLNDKFRGYQYWHSYSDKQISSLINLIRYLSKKHNINIKNGLNQYLKSESSISAFEFKQKIIDGKTGGLYSHTSVRKDKWDCYPHPKLIEHLLTL